MAKIYLIRHGESIANTQGIYQGQTYNTDLSPLGVQQVHALGQYFSGKNLEKIYTSPLIRTKKTAEQIGLATGARVVLDQQIIESNHGEWEGKSKLEIQAKWGDTLRTWNNDPEKVVFPGGESFEDLESRVLNRFSELMQDGGDIAVTTHDNVIRVILMSVLNMSPDRFWSLRIDPAAVTIIEVKNREARVLVLNYTEHLKECLTNLSQHAL